MLKRELKGIIHLTWCTKEGARGTVPEMTMRQAYTWCTSRELNPGLNDGNSNNINSNVNNNLSSNGSNNVSRNGSSNSNINVSRNLSRNDISNVSRNGSSNSCSIADSMSAGMVGAMSVTSAIATCQNFVYGWVQWK